MSAHDHHDDPHGYGHDEPETATRVGIVFLCVITAIYLVSLL